MLNGIKLAVHTGKLEAEPEERPRESSMGGGSKLSVEPVVMLVGSHWFRVELGS